MKFLTYQASTGPKVGVLIDDQIFDLSDIVSDAPETMRGVIEAGQSLQDKVTNAETSGLEARGNLTEASLLPVIPNPGKIICLGLNYAEHAKEGGREVPKHPTIFFRCTTSLAAHGEDIRVPKVSHMVDYEAELLIVIGKRCKDVSKDTALDYVFGYCAFNDISIRDYQRRTLQWASGKNFDATGPMGPVIVTHDELPIGALGLRVKAILNGKIMQDGSTDDMIFDIAKTISDVSEIMTLEPGDVIATGTPSGVGFARDPQVWMKAGDEIRIEIDGIPPLVNKMI